ncbi:MAG: saccharopine dehydrogenase C-terminal domain-containing protein [Actinomycetota bacterium]
MAQPIAVLGAGAMGSVAARLLARHKDEVDLLVLDVDADRASGVVGANGFGEARGFDATSGELEQILKEVRAVAACLPYRLNLPVMESALAARCHYADLGGLFHTTRKQLELTDRFEAASVSAVLGIGSAPGLTNVLAKLGVDRLDRVDSIDLVDGAIEEGGGEFGLPYSAETIIDEFTLPAMTFEGGELHEVPAGSGVVQWEFPEPLGTMPAIYTLHSEPATLPDTIPGVRDVRWRLALPPAVHDGFALLTSIGLADREPVETPSGTVVPRDLLIEVLNRMPTSDGEAKDVEYLDIRVAGEKDGARAVATERALFTPPPEGFSAGSFGTALPITVAVRWMAEGRVAPGVHPPETAFDPQAFVDELAREGVVFSSSVDAA